MRRLLPSLLLFLFIVVPARAQDASVPAKGVTWEPFEKAVASAQDRQKYVLIDMYAPWCGWCKKMQRTVYTESGVQDYLHEHFVTTRLDVTAKQTSYQFHDRTLPAPQLAGALGLRGTPTTVFLKPDGSYLARRPGFVESENFLTMLHYIGSGAHENQSYKEFVTSK